MTAGFKVQYIYERYFCFSYVIYTLFHFHPFEWPTPSDINSNIVKYNISKALIFTFQLMSMSSQCRKMVRHTLKILQHVLPPVKIFI